MAAHGGREPEGDQRRVSHGTSESSVPARGACARCGVALTPATAFLSERGSVCWPCFEHFQNERGLANEQAVALEASLTRRAKRLAVVHGTMWGASIIIATEWAGLSGWFSTLLLAGVVALGVGLGLRRRWAYEAALIFDGAGTLGLLAYAAYCGPMQGWPFAVASLFPLSLVALARALRLGYGEQRPAGDAVFDLQPASLPRLSVKRWLLTAAVLVAAALVGGGVYLIRRPRPDPALELMRAALPAWQAARARRGSAASGRAARDLVAGAGRWPALASAFETLDRVWPDETAVAAAVKSINRALADAGLRYFTGAEMVADRPFVLSYTLAGRVPWRIGARTVDVLRLRRLDTFNIEFTFEGFTEEGLPVVMLDRVEATLARELPEMYAKRGQGRQGLFNDFDRLALGHLRAGLETRLGAGVGPAAAALAERDRLLEDMRTRLRGDDVKLAAPDGFVLGEAWLERLEPESSLTRPGGPLVLDTDLKAVARADEKLRDGPTARLLGDAVDVMALETEAHEARHALDEVDPVGPPPPGLFEVMPDSSTRMIGMADKELRAFLGELHDSPLPACATLAQIMRTVYGRWARREPHAFATLAILRQLGANADLEAEDQLSPLCAVPDAELRARIAAAWEKLYGAPMPASQRLPSP